MNASLARARNDNKPITTLKNMETRDIEKIYNFLSDTYSFSRCLFWLRQYSCEVKSIF